MKIILSPAKSQDFDTPAPTKKRASLLFPKETKMLVSNLKQYTKQDLMKTMQISDKLAELNQKRFTNWSKAPTKQALFAFTGDVYQAFADYVPKAKELNYLERHVRIISGLYGILTPLTEMKPYRLEMGRKIPVTHKGTDYDNLYDLWRDQITSYFSDEDVIINLASTEYSKVIDTKKLIGKLIHIVFKIEKGGQAKIVPIFAKRERGNMTRWLAEKSIKQPGEIKKYTENGYRFDRQQSDATHFVFIKSAD